MCDEIREQPDGEDEDDELDPRVEIELENLNKASSDINILEKELDEARAAFRQQLTDAARNLKSLANTLGNNIDKARPYFEALSQAKKAQLECQNAAITYERAFQLHKGARETIAVAEEKLMSNPGMFDAAWQEMLNNANVKVMEAEKERVKNETLHHEATLAYVELENRVSRLNKQLRKSISKARPYFDQKTRYMGHLESQKLRIHDLEVSFVAAKSHYSKSLRNLELISEDIHRKRNMISEASSRNAPSIAREEGVGAEAQPTRRRSVQRRLSEDRIKRSLARHHSQGFKSGRFRSSLVLDLDVDFDLDDSVDFEEIQKSPSSKSVDIGCISMKYYDDFQILDVTPFLEMDYKNYQVQNSVVETPSSEKNSLKPRTQSSTSLNPLYVSSVTGSEFSHVSGINGDRKISSSSEFIHVGRPNDDRKISTCSTESEVDHIFQRSGKARSGTTHSEFEMIVHANPGITPQANLQPLNIRSKNTSPSNKLINSNRFSMIAETEEVNVSDNILVVGIENPTKSDRENCSKEMVESESTSGNPTKSDSENCTEELVERESTSENPTKSDSENCTEEMVESECTSGYPTKSDSENCTEELVESESTSGNPTKSDSKNCTEEMVESECTSGNPTKSDSENCTEVLVESESTSGNPTKSDSENCTEELVESESTSGNPTKSDSKNCTEEMVESECTSGNPTNSDSENCTEELVESESTSGNPTKSDSENCTEEMVECESTSENPNI